MFPFLPTSKILVISFGERSDEYGEVGRTDQSSFKIIPCFLGFFFYCCMQTRREPHVSRRQEQDTFWLIINGHIAAAGYINVHLVYHSVLRTFLNAMHFIIKFNCILFKYILFTIICIDLLPLICQLFVSFWLTFCRFWCERLFDDLLSQVFISFFPIKVFCSDRKYQLVNKAEGVVFLVLFLLYVDLSWRKTILPF